MKIHKKLKSEYMQMFQKGSSFKRINKLSQMCKIERISYRISQVNYVIVQADSDKKEFWEIIKSAKKFQ